MSSDGRRYNLDVRVSFVCVLVTRLNSAKMVEPIDMLFWEDTRVGPRNHVLDRVLANTIKRSAFSGDAGCRFVFSSVAVAAITVANCF